MTTADTKLLLTPLEAAVRLGIGRTSLYGLLRSGELPSVTIGRCRRVKPEELVAFAASLKARPTHRDTRQVPSSGG
jgi:excisionase family DNA binding protein